MGKNKEEVNPDDIFKNKRYERSKLNPDVSYDFSVLYEKANEEMVAQQTKRDQIITFYLAMFAIVVPFALSSEGSVYIKGAALFLVAVLGWMLSLIIIRYRVYKEAYWLCCQAITNLMNFKHNELDKKTIQAVYYVCMEKKASAFFVGQDKKEFSKKLFFKKNIFSGETIYFLIQALLTALMWGLSVILLINFLPVWNYIVGIILFLIVFSVLVRMFFKELMSIYSVLIDGKDTSFNIAFTKAWFLHFYVEEDGFSDSE